MLPRCNNNNPNPVLLFEEETLSGFTGKSLNVNQNQEDGTTEVKAKQ